MPRVAVVVPAYNPGAYLRATLASVIGQSFTDWQAVVVDDGSTENLDWVDGIHPGVCRLRQSNHGLSAARNAGMTATDSEYVAFLDADDVWLPGKLTTQVPATADARAALSSTAFDIIDGAGERVSGGYEGYAESYLDLLQGDGICASTALARRAVLDEVGVFDTTLDACEDWDLWLRIACDHKVIKVPSVLARKRQHGSNMSRDYVMILRNAIVILRRHELANRSGSPAAQAARIGQHRVRELVGIQAFDRFRAAVPRSPAVAARHLAAALHYAPSYTLRSVKNKITPQLSRRRLRRRHGPCAPAPRRRGPAAGEVMEQSATCR